MILQELSQIWGGEAVTVKGGVSLRLFFESLRYSEDIDFDGASQAAAAIRACISGIFSNQHLSHTLRRLGIRGLDPGEGPNKDTETTFRYKFGVVLGGDVRYPTKVEVSFRETHPNDRVVVEPPSEDIVARYGLNATPVRHYTRDAAVRQKIGALCGRREAQARDVFDLHVLGATSPEDGLLQFLANELDSGCLREAYKRALDISFKEYEGHVLEFLEGDARALYGREAAWEDIQLQVAALMERVTARKEES